MSLVQECLESLSVYSPSSEYALPADEAAKYTIDAGATLINMESFAALNDVFDTDFAVEEALLQGVVEAKRCGTPVEEGLKEFSAKVKEKATNAWTKVKEWFAKMKEKVKAWFENVKRVFRSMFAKPVDFVKRYRTEIESVDSSEFSASVRIYKYTNIDGYDGFLTNQQKSITDQLMKLAEEGISRVGKPVSDPDDPNNEDDLDSSVKMSRMRDDIVNRLEKDFGTSETRSKKLFAYFRGNAQSEEDKIVPQKLNMKEWTSYVIDNDKTVRGIEKQQKSVDNVYATFIKKVEEWQGKYSSSAGMSKILSSFTASAATIQSTINDATNAYITAAKERASVGYQLSKKALSWKHKESKATEKK